MANDWRDFNDAAEPIAVERAGAGRERAAVRAALLGRLESVLATLLPAGRVRHGVFAVGNIDGTAGDSLEVALHGEKAGLWMDHATREGGDVFDLIAVHYRLDVQREFARVLEEANRLLGQAPAAIAAPRKRNGQAEDLGPPSAKWDYLDANGQLIACVYRYDPANGSKTYRPWDARRRRSAPPTPRPLYHQPGLATAEEVVLVEGEKCAQALIDAGVCATTAMHGANAPVAKTDWSPLAGKRVLIWPDHDAPGATYARAAAEALLAAGAVSCAILQPPADKPEGWDAADALAEGCDIAGFLRGGERMPVTVRAQRSIDVSGLSERSDDAITAVFTHTYGDDWRHCAAWGQWLAWDGRRWCLDRTLAVQDLARCVCRAVARSTDKPAQAIKLASATTIFAVERVARSDPRHAATVALWDADPWLLNTPQGIVDLHGGALRPHAREAYLTRLTTAAPRGECPRWGRFLDDVTGGDRELQSYLQRVVGYCLTGTTSEHALFFLYGTGANGKSVFVNVIATLLGDYAARAPMDTFMDSRHEHHPTELAGLRGARFVAAVETEEGRRWNEAKLKAITGGDAISARFMRQDFFEFVPQFKLVIVGNHKPAIRNVDDAMQRRLHLVPFTVTIPPARRDRDLLDKLLVERDGILAWAVAGCVSWQRMGLAPPPSVVEATAEYFEAEDAHGRWIEERAQRDPNAFVLSRDLYADWKQWAEANGEYVGSLKRFAAALIRHGCRKKRNNVGQQGFIGLRLLPPPPAWAYRQIKW
jgi:putative DNA primase/helicase